MQKAATVVALLAATSQASKPAFKYGECALQANPANPDPNFKGGHILLAQGSGSDMYIRVGAGAFAQENAFYGLSVNANAWDGKDCATGGGHYNPTSAPHGKWTNDPATNTKHVGDLPMIKTNSDLLGELWAKVKGP